jgi:carbonic anhydrase
MDAIDELLTRHEAGLATSTAHAESIDTPRPRLRIAVLTCMDARIKLFDVLGLKHGDAHILRNAGGLATDDAMRSLLLSQHGLGTQEVMVIQHTDCGLQGLHDADLAGRIEDATGHPVPFAFGGFDDVDASVRASLTQLRAAPWLVRRDAVRGFVYDVATSKLREVSYARHSSESNLR